MIKDWNRTGWEPMTNFIWRSSKEILVYENKGAFEDKIIFPGLDAELESINKITAEELGMDIKWKSQASSEYLNSEMREQRFLRRFQFFAPMLQELASINPELYTKYFMRWLRWAGQEMDMRGYKFLIPSPEELMQGGVGPESYINMMESMTGQMKDGQSPGNIDVAQSGSGGK